MDGNGSGLSLLPSFSYTHLVIHFLRQRDSIKSTTKPSPHLKSRNANILSTCQLDTNSTESRVTKIHVGIYICTVLSMKARKIPSKVILNIWIPTEIV